MEDALAEDPLLEGALVEDVLLEDLPPEDPLLEDALVEDPLVEDASGRPAGAVSDSWAGWFPWFGEAVRLLRGGVVPVGGPSWPYRGG